MIFLNILKIIGIVLVVLLCILLVLILLVLFYPIKYRILGTEVYDKENKSDIHIRLSWIFHLIGVNVDIDPELTAGLRILFVKKNLMKDSDTSNDRSDNNGDGGSCDSDSCNSDSIEENIKNISETDIKNTDNIAVAEEKINANATKAEKSVSEDEYTNATNAYSNNKGKEKIKRLTGKIKKILKDDSCKAALNKIKTELINLLKAIMPYKLYLKAEFSAGSPDKTGMVLGILAMFPIGYRNKWKIRPDFEREEIYIDSEFDIKGHIFLYKILVIAIRVLVDKNCRKLYNEIRK
ncbi:MAG: hypothetical protein PUE83_04790 [Lachnobacterium sp.]|nr:hypothetical protein [Lachnobacterium sp.]